MILGQREVESTRGTFELVRNPAGYDREKAYMLAAASRAAGHLTRPALDPRSKASLDSRPGVSGAAILSDDRVPGDSGSSSKFLQTYGVLSSVFDPEDFDGWGIVSSEYPNAFMLYSRLGDEAVIARRDDPLPALTFLPGAEIPCGDQVTVVWQDEQGNQHDDQVCSYNEYSEVGEHTFEGVEVPEGHPVVVTRPDRPLGNGYVSAPCRAVYFEGGEAKGDPGYMYGVMGALSFGSAQNDWQNLSPEAIVTQHGGGLGSFFGICGPHRTTPYTSLWRYLFIKGNRVNTAADALEGPYAQGELRKAVTCFWEERVAGGEVTARPPSFKMCPPGSIMRGLVAARETNPVRYTGIRDIICAEPGGPDTYHSTMDLVEVDRDYQIFGRPFDLSQFVGWPSGNDDTIKCGSGNYVRHLKFNVQNNVVTYISVDCDP
ncbi:MAG: hypothetical protein R3E66_01545 [bacterium]